MASSSSASSKPGLSLIEDEYWYAGPLSERKSEVILSKLGEPGSFLVRDSLLPDSDYVLSVNAGKDIFHYDIKILPSNECTLNKYTFTNLPDAVVFYTENRLGTVFLKEPEEPVVSGPHLKYSGQNVIRLAAPEAVKPPRTSPLVAATASIEIPPRSSSPQASKVTGQNSPRSSSPQTRKLVAPESLRRPQTPPNMSRHQNTASPRRSRKLVAPDSMRPASHTPPLVMSVEGSQIPSTAQTLEIGDSDTSQPIHLQSKTLGYSTDTSPNTKRMEPAVKLGVSDATVESRLNIDVLKAPVSVVGDNWLDTHSGAGSQVSLGSQSPKPQSIQRFVVDLEDNSQSQTSDVDCGYIAASQEVESVFVTSDFLYVSPPPSDVKSDSVSGNRNANDANENADKADEQEQQLSVSERRRAFEQKRTKVKDDSNGKAAPKPIKKPPPAVPQRSSSISSLPKQQQSGGSESDQSLPSSRKQSTESSNQLKVESIAEEQEIPPPPPMSTHPGLASKAEPEENTQQDLDDQAMKEKSPTEVEPQETNGMVRPRPKARRVSIPAEDVTEKQSSTCEKQGSDTDRAAVSESPGPTVVAAAPTVIKEESETLTSVSAPLLDTGSGDASDKLGEAEKDRQSETVVEETDHGSEEPTSTATFGHAAHLSAPTQEPPQRARSEECLEVKGNELADIDPSKKMGADVSTFKPVPKPRSFYRHSTYSASRSGPSFSVSPPPDNMEYPYSPSRLSPPPMTGYSLTPEMKRNSIHFPSPENRREMILRAQSMSLLPNSGSASPRMVVRGEQRSQMPPGFVVFSRSQEAVIGRHPTLSASTMLRRLQERENEGAGDGGKDGKKESAPNTAAAPMNTKRGTKKRRSIFRRKQ